MTMFWKSWILTYWSYPQGRGGGGLRAIFATVLLHSWFPLIRYATRNCSKRLNFDLLTPSPVCVCVCVCVCCGRGGGLLVKYSLACSCILWFAFNLICNAMQLDHVLKKVEIWPYDSVSKVGAGGGGLWAKKCYHVAAFVIPFNLICNVTVFRKGWIFTVWSQPQCQGGGGWG